MQKTVYKNNIFTKIINKELNSNIIFEDPITLIFQDIKPIAPIHLIAIPKEKYSSFSDFIQKASTNQNRIFWNNINTIITKVTILTQGYKLIINTKGNGGQLIDHFHVHILGGTILEKISFSGKKAPKFL